MRSCRKPKICSERDALHRRRQLQRHKQLKLSSLCPSGCAGKQGQRGLSHYPSKPAGMDNALYQLGYDGSINSNIAYGDKNAATSTIQYFDDLGANNSWVAGHRRWLLSSCLAQVGVGQVDTYNAIYVAGSPASSYVTDVAWPARRMPTCFFDPDAQWSLSTVVQSIGSDDSISVQVRRRRDDSRFWESQPKLREPRVW